VALGGPTERLPFLTHAEVEVSDRAAHAELTARLGRIAQVGPSMDVRRSRHLDDGVFELKTPRGFRLIYFFDRGRLIVCSEL